YATFPQTQGHEVAGIVEDFGGPYDGPVRVGDRVAVEPLRPCGTCYPCRYGRYNCCTRLAVLGAHVPGGLAELIAVRTAALYPARDLDAELGAPAVIRSAMDVVASSGRIVILGISNQEVSLPVIEFTRKELTVLGSRNNAGVFGDAVDLVRRNRERVRALVTHRFTLEQVPQA